ncbi:MAG TPA: DUF3800 domain-containing protein [Nitrospira sp.]|nr:DUF3800 domain-containing protein [Nitrospira sp.]
MFTAYFDASGQEHEHPYMVVAGFVSSAKDWCDFSEEWKTTLDRYDLKTFHAVDCQNCEGEFRTWKGQEKRRIGLWCDLLDLIKKFTFQKFGIGIVIDDWRTSFSQERKRQLKVNAYVLCAMASAERVSLWARRQGIKTPIEYVYESGDLGSGLLKEHFDEQGYPTPSFKYKEDRLVRGTHYPGTVPLQAADFLAYEIFLTKKIFRKKGNPSLSRPMRQFTDMPEAVKIFSGSDLKNLEKHFEYPKKVRGVWRVSL